MAALQPLDLLDFTGGANLRANVLQVADNESPGMLNVEIEPGQGFYTRSGFQRWNKTDVIANLEEWDPRNGESHPLADGSFQIYIANAGTIHASGGASEDFVDLEVECDCLGYLADYASWGDTMYIAAGSKPPHKRFRDESPVALKDPSDAGSGGAWNEDYTTFEKGNLPTCDLMVAHASYLFVAGTTESGDGFSGRKYPNRIRWSHPNEPEDWASKDFLDIETGGGKITGIQSFQDHLLIFKTDSLWALYGYDLDSWQLVQISRAIGTPTPTAIARSESACYFFSASNRNAVFEYNGQQLSEITMAVRPFLEGILKARYQDVWLGFVARRLWVSVPASEDDPVNGNTIGVYDPDVSGGVWVGHRLGQGSLRCILEGSDIDADLPLAVVAGDSGAAAVISIGESDEARLIASDFLLENGEPTPFYAYYRTGWKNAGRPELNKSWLRTRFLAPLTPKTVTVHLDVYHNYDSSNVRRSLSGVQLGSGHDVFWTLLGAAGDPTHGGFDWTVGGDDDPEGADWGLPPSGSEIGRTGTGLGLARAVQLEFSTYEPGKPWGFDGIFMKVKMRRFTT
jgi:hypothetical protein